MAPKRAPRFPCSVCKKACKINQQAIACDHCDKWTHKSCVNMSTVSYNRLGDSEEQWFCPDCSNINNSGIYNIPTSTVQPSSPESITSSNKPPPDTSLNVSSIPSDVSCTGTPTTPSNVDDTSNLSLHSQLNSRDGDIIYTSSPKQPRAQSRSANKARNLRLLNINFQSLRKKGKFLEVIINDLNPDVIIGTETWLNGNIKSAEIVPPSLGYDIVRRDRQDSYGGVLIATKQDLQLSNVEISKRVEMIHGSIMMKGGKRMVVAAYYRPPGRVDDQYTNDSATEIENLKRKAGRNILTIAGDFNLPDIDWSTNTIKGHNYSRAFNNAYLDMVSSNDLEQQVDFPTRRDKSTLDLVMTTHPSFKVRCKPLPSIGNSDHDIVLYDTALSPYRHKPIRRKIYLWKKTNTVAMKDDIQDFNNTYQRPDPADPCGTESMWMAIRDMLKATMEKHVPTKTTAARHSDPWITTSIRRTIRRKQRAHNKARKTGKKRDQDRYKRLQTETRFEIRQASRNYMRDIVCDEFKTNSKRFWSFIKSKSQESMGVAPLKDKNGFLRSDSQGKAEILGEQFQSVFTQEDITSIPDKGVSNYPDMPPITINETGVRNLLQKLNPCKAT